MKKKKKTTKKITKIKKKIKKTKKLDPLNNIDEKEFLIAVENITKNLAYKFKFGYHEIEDMKQQIVVFALEGIKNYDHIRPLENFLWTHVRNRLFNYKRDNYQRPNKPCLTCPLYDPSLKSSTSGCSKFSNKNDCEPYNSWTNRNNAKKNLVHFSPIEDVKDYGNLFKEKTTDSGSDLASKEIIDMIENQLNGDLREIYLKLKNGCKVSKADRTKLFNHIQTIIPYE